MEKASHMASAEHGCYCGHELRVIRQAQSARNTTAQRGSENERRNGHDAAMTDCSQNMQRLLSEWEGASWPR